MVYDIPWVVQDPVFNSHYCEAFHTRQEFAVEHPMGYITPWENLWDIPCDNLWDALLRIFVYRTTYITSYGVSSNQMSNGNSAPWNNPRDDPGYVVWMSLVSWDVSWYIPLTVQCYLPIPQFVRPLGCPSSRGMYPVSYISYVMPMGGRSFHGISHRTLHLMLMGGRTFNGVSYIARDVPWDRPREVVHPTWAISSHARGEPSIPWDPMHPVA